MSGIEGSLLVYLPCWLGFERHGRGGRGKPIPEAQKYLSRRGGAVLRVPKRTLVEVASKCLILSDVSLGSRRRWPPYGFDKGSAAIIYLVSLRLDRSQNRTRS